MVKTSMDNTPEKIFEIKGKPIQIQKAIHLIRVQVGDVPQGTPFQYPAAGSGMQTMQNYATPTISLGGTSSGTFSGYRKFFLLVITIFYEFSLLKKILLISVHKF